jgi:enoyl-CoA hydratase/carnithine racemase
LIRAVGKSKAMELILTGEMLTAEEVGIPALAPALALYGR